MRARRNPEALIYEQLAEWLSWKHRDLQPLWHFDLSGVHNASPVSRALYSRLNQRGYPDFFLAHPIFYPRAVVAGLFLEIKAERARLTKRGGAWASDHIAEQAEMLERLRGAGYAAYFGVGVEQCQQLIEDYLRPIKARDVHQVAENEGLF
jgi:hypothetical protein